MFAQQVLPQWGSQPVSTARRPLPGAYCRAALLGGLLAVANTAPMSTAQAGPGTRSHPDHDGLDLVVHQFPGAGALPTSLDMRPGATALALAQSQDGPGDPEADIPPTGGIEPVSSPAPLSRAERTRRAERAIFGQKPLSDKVIFRVNMGWGLDGGEPVADSRLLDEEALYDPLRTYYYGDLVIGSRGLVSPSLSSYFASQFRVDQTVAGATPVPSLYDADLAGNGDPSDLWIRSGYGTWQGVGDVSSLKPLYIRAGRQFRYGPAIAHFDGLTIGYDTPVLSIGAFTGKAVDVTGLDISRWYASPGVISGLDGRLDLYQLTGAPLVLSGEVLTFDNTTHLRGTLALRINRNIALRTTLRTRKGVIARTGVQLRARIGRVTLIDLRLENRAASDWMYDLFAADTIPGTEQEDNPLHYFRLGRVLPRVYYEARAGTVLLRNIDVLVHSRGAIRQGGDEERAPHATSFAQVGAAIEVHVRRSINLGVGALGRRYWRVEPTPVDSVADFPDYTNLDFATDAYGERGFAEGNATVRYSQGARKFSAGAEIYLRAYDIQTPYELPDDDDMEDPVEIPERLAGPELRWGGRFTVEAWASDNLRLKVEYDVTSALLIEPGLLGIKSLRIMAEGRF